MRMKNSLKPRFPFAICLLIALRIPDLYLTYRHTPDLAGEWNPIVSFFRISWAGFLVIQVGLICLISFLGYFYYTRKPLEDVPADLTINQFAHYYFYGPDASVPRWKQGFPKNWRNVLAFNGFVLIVLGIAISIFAIVNNLWIITNMTFYSDFIVRYGNYFYTFLILFMTALSFVGFFILEFRVHKQRLRRRENPPHL